MLNLSKVPTHNEIEALLMLLKKANSHFIHLEKASSLKEYFEPALRWNPTDGEFPYRKWLQENIVKKILIIHGEEKAKLAHEQLNQAFTVETGSHLCLPRNLDRISNDTVPEENINTLVHQGTILSTALHSSENRRLHLSLNTGRIPPNNLTSAAYLQIFKSHSKNDQGSDGNNFLRLVSNVWKNTPQVFIPSLTLKTGIEQIDVILNKNLDSFSKQISALHSYLYDQILKGTQSVQATLDYEELSWEMLIQLLEDHQSLTYKIFSNTSLLNQFMATLCHIKTGWTQGQAPFDFLKEEHGRKTIAQNRDFEFLGPQEWVIQLKNKQIIPKGVLQFFIFMVEGGLLPIGGMYQSLYCTEIRDRSIRFLLEIHETDRAEHLRGLPTFLMVISPAWGIQQEKEDFHLLTYSDHFRRNVSLTQEDLRRICHLTGRDALLLGSFPLLKFLYMDLNLFPENEKTSLHNHLYRWLQDQGRILVF